MDRVDAAILVLRVLTGTVVAIHGFNHAFGGGRLPGAASWFESLGLRHGMVQATMSAVVEVAAGIGIVFGILTPVAAAAVIAVMLVAGIVAHRQNGFFIFRDGYEYVLFIAVTALVIAITGPGRVSVDAALGIVMAGWAGFGVALGLAVVGVAALLGATYRPVARVGA
ncbi:putative oxidoreductase [Rhodococcus sp. 27YEA15]|uniref:DoxX family protein n=1 Tax=Rhodococcus sp. 27YEA15 TaxID=3156259 RepID=UPI003C7A7FF2